MAGGVKPKYFPTYFAPDLDPAWFINPGVLTDVTDLVPTKRGTLQTYTATDNFQNIDNAIINETTYSLPLIGGIFKRTDGTARLIVGTKKRLMEHNASIWVDVSVGGVDYSVAANWCFTTFGNDLIAVSKTNAPQVSTAQNAAFAALGGGPPKASVCTTNKNFVLFGDCNDGANDYGDQVWWSALGNDASWTVSAATQAGNYRLRDTPGKVTALINMRDAVVAYKEDSLYIGDYQGSPLLWTWRLVSDKVGCAAPQGIAVVNGIHYFLHRTGVKRFDGASVQDVGHAVNRYLFTKMGAQTFYATAQAVYDEYEGLILWYFKDSGASSDQRRYALAYAPESGQFGFVKNAWHSSDTMRAVVQATLSDIGAWISTYATQSYTPNVLTVGYSTSLGGSILRRPAFGFAGGNATLQMVTGDIGDEIYNTTLTRIKPRALQGDASAMSSVTVKGKAYELASYDAGTSFVADLTKHRWDGLKSNRWLQLTVPVFNYGEIAGLYLTTTTSGSE